MTKARGAARRPVRAPGRGRGRRWMIAGGVLACWLVALNLTGSALGATFLLAVVAGLVAAMVIGLRAMGFTRDHPWLRRAASRPWRDGQDVLNLALRHLPEVFIVSPSGSLIAPDVVELQLNPADLASLRDWMELDLVGESATEVYADQAARHGARFAGSSRPEVYLVPDGSVPPGRYRLRRGLPGGARYAPGPWDEPSAEPLRYPDDDYSHGSLEPAWSEQEAGSLTTAMDPVLTAPRTVMDGLATVMEQVRPAVPVLRLVTGSSVAETAMSGARAGRGLVELTLPDVPTVSRVHATFTYATGRWWVTSQGMNGLSVNGVPVADRQALSDGDSIRWGKKDDSPLSTVEIG